MKKFSLLTGAAALATIGGVFAAWIAFDATQNTNETGKIISNVDVDETIEVLGNTTLKLTASEKLKFVATPEDNLLDAKVQLDLDEFEEDEAVFTLNYEINDDLDGIYFDEMNACLFNVKSLIKCSFYTFSDGSENDGDYLGNYQFEWVEDSSDNYCCFICAEAEDGQLRTSYTYEITKSDLEDSGEFIGRCSMFSEDMEYSYAMLNEDNVQKFIDAAKNTKFKFELVDIEFSLDFE